MIEDNKEVVDGNGADVAADSENVKETDAVEEAAEVLEKKNAKTADSDAVKADAKDAGKTEKTDETDDDEEAEDAIPIEPFATFEWAIVRMPATNFADGLTNSNLGKPDYTTLLGQHMSYTAVLRTLGLEIIKLPSLADYPDAYYVEDVAVITEEVVVITRPGAKQRLGETEHIRETLAELRPLVEIVEPGTLDGGDVMRIDQTFYVGLSERTNKEGADQLARILGEFGYVTHAVPLAEGLHLKSHVNYIGRNTLLLSEAWVNHPLFAEYEKIVVPPEEAYAANTLLVNGRLLTPMGFRATQALLREAGFLILEIDATEMEKMDGGLSCMSLRF